MKTKIKSILKSNLFKITSLNSISVLIKIGVGLITSKLFALFVGPAGMALVGNFRSFTGTLESISTLGFSNGIINHIAENQSDQSKKSKIISTVFFCILFVSLTLSLILFIFANQWNLYVFNAHFQFEKVFKIMAFTLPFYALSVFLLAVINGLEQFKKVIFINIFGNILGLFVSVLLIIKYQTFGALLSIAVTPSILFFFTFYLVNKHIHLFKILKFKSFDYLILKKLSSFSLMALITALLSPIVYIAIRKNIITTLNINQAGFYETISRFSSYYLMFITSILSLYFFPKLSTAKNKIETKTIFYSYYKNLIPIFALGLISIYFFRYFIIKTLFTADFMPVSDLFFWQLIGDFFKVCSWILAYNLLAKKHTKFYILSETSSLLFTYFSTIYLIQTNGLQGVVIAHFLTYLIYFITLIIYFNKELF